MLTGVLLPSSLLFCPPLPPLSHSPSNSLGSSLPSHPPSSPSPPVATAPQTTNVPAIALGALLVVILLVAMVFIVLAVVYMR